MKIPAAQNAIEAEAPTIRTTLLSAMPHQPAGGEVAADIHDGDRCRDDGGGRGREAQALDLQGRQEADDGEPAAGVGAEAERDGERPAAARHLGHFMQHRPSLDRQGIELVARPGAQQQGHQHEGEAPAATSQAMRHDVPGRTTAAISIIEPAPAGM